MAMTGFGWWDMAVTVANRRTALSGHRHEVRWDPFARVWRVSVTARRRGDKR